MTAPAASEPCPACGDRPLGFGCPEPLVHLYPERYAEVAAARAASRSSGSMRSPVSVGSDNPYAWMLDADGWCTKCGDAHDEDDPAADLCAPWHPANPRGASRDPEPSS